MLIADCSLLQCLQHHQGGRAIVSARQSLLGMELSCRRSMCILEFCGSIHTKQQLLGVMYLASFQEVLTYDRGC